MPHATAAHPFEWLIHGWAAGLRGGDGFLALVDDDGAITRIVDADHVSFGNRCLSHAARDALVAGAGRWIYYDPFDAPEYAWLEWREVPQATWRALLGGDAAAARVGAGVELERVLAAIPPSWGVMF